MSLFFIITESITLLIIVGLLLILSGVWPPDSPWAPWWQMPENVIARICKLAKLSPHDVIYDLGCGTGKALCFAAKKYSVRGIGIEIDPLRFFLAVWNVRRFGVEKNIIILKKNFFHVNIADATVIFIYLVPAALKRLVPKFLNELRPGTNFFSYIYPMPLTLFKGKLQLMQYDKKNKIYYYQLRAEAKK